MKKFWLAFYTAAVVGICLAPLAGLAWQGTAEGSSENRRLAEWPELKTEEGWNTGYLSGLGDWFADHFAYRQELVTAEAEIKSSLFGVSSASGVIVGKDGWLYYRDSLEDFLGTEVLSDRGIYCCAHNLRLLQGWVESQGRSFLFTVAPNKNTLYGEHMPDYYSVRVSEENNLAKLEPVLEAEGVNYVDLKTVLAAQPETVYHKRDSHWDNRGAAIAYETLMDQAGFTYTAYSSGEWSTREDYEGDLDAMLFPQNPTAETEYETAIPLVYDYVGEVESNFDPLIETVNPSAQGSLVMFRDSFGNALLPFFANSFSRAFFTRGVPYQADAVLTYDADLVIAERAERFIPELAKTAPVMEAPAVRLNGEKASGEAVNTGTLDNTRSGSYLYFHGSLSQESREALADAPNARIFLEFADGECREAFLLQSEEENEFWDYGLYRGSQTLAPGEQTVSVYAVSGERLILLEEKQTAVQIETQTAAPIKTVG